METLQSFLEIIESLGDDMPEVDEHILPRCPYCGDFMLFHITGRNISGDWEGYWQCQEHRSWER